jgi:DNA polymerase I-like protein with 3'-5' exonuclease and polymerase domains
MSVDIETTGIDPWTIDITRIGFADETCSISVPWCDWQDVEGVRGRHLLIEELVRRLLRSSRLKVFQNGIFDRTVFRVHKIECRPPFFDTLYAHMIYSPGTKHDLGFQAGQELHAPAWKAEFRGFKKENEK